MTKSSDFTASVMAATLGMHVSIYLDQTRIGEATSASGGYIMSDSDVYIPDVGFISYAHLLEEPPREAPVLPDMAIEVKSSTESTDWLRVKARNYLAFGTRLVWLVFRDEQTVEVYLHDTDPETFAFGATLNGADALPGFVLTVEQVFVDLKDL